MPLHRRPTHSAAPRGTRRLPSDGRRHQTRGHRSDSTVAILPMIPEGDLPAGRSAPGTAGRPAWSSGSPPTPADTDRRPVQARVVITRRRAVPTRPMAVPLKATVDDAVTAPDAPVQTAIPRSGGAGGAAHRDRGHPDRAGRVVRRSNGSGSRGPTGRPSRRRCAAAGPGPGTLRRSPDGRRHRTDRCVRDVDRHPVRPRR